MSQRCGERSLTPVPAVVCGHSYGGLVVTEAAAAPSLRVHHLAYLAAAVPDTGESMQALAASLGVVDDDGGEEVAVLDDGRIQLMAEAARATLFHDCPEDRAELAISRLRPINPATGGQTISEAAWRQIPATLVEAADDQLPRLVCAGFDTASHEVVQWPTQLERRLVLPDSFYSPRVASQRGSIRCVHEVRRGEKRCLSSLRLLTWH